VPRREIHFLPPPAYPRAATDPHPLSLSLSLSLSISLSLSLSFSFVPCNASTSFPSHFSEPLSFSSSLFSHPLSFSLSLSLSRFLRAPSRLAVRGTSDFYRFAPFMFIRWNKAPMGSLLAMKLKSRLSSGGIRAPFLSELTYRAGYRYSRAK